MNIAQMLITLANHCHNAEWLSESQLAKLFSSNIVHARTVLDGDVKLLNWKPLNDLGDIWSGAYIVENGTERFRAMHSSSVISHHATIEAAMDACEHHARATLGWEV